MKVLKVALVGLVFGLVGYFSTLNVEAEHKLLAGILVGICTGCGGASAAIYFLYVKDMLRNNDNNKGDRSGPSNHGAAGSTSGDAKSVENKPDKGDKPAARISTVPPQEQTWAVKFNDQPSGQTEVIVNLDGMSRRTFSRMMERLAKVQSVSWAISPLSVRRQGKNNVLRGTIAAKDSGSTEQQILQIIG